jgi:hypothetical protein
MSLDILIDKKPIHVMKDFLGLGKLKIIVCNYELTNWHTVESFLYSIYHLILLNM